MGLLSFFKRDAVESAAAGAAPSPAVQLARTRARQRLIGALVLLSIGVVGFPLLFESQPRPIPVDIPITIPGKDSAPPLAIPSPRPASAGTVVTGKSGEPVADVITETQADAGRDVTALGAPAGAASRATAKPVAPVPAPPAAPSPAPSAVAVAKAPPPASATAAAPARASASAPAAAPRAPGSDADAQRARALLNGQASPPPPASATAAARFIVQIGAFADAAVAREARLKVEKLGLQTYTQVADTPGGKRIRVRVGPYAQRADADRAVARLRAAGLPAALLTL